MKINCWIKLSLVVVEFVLLAVNAGAADRQEIRIPDIQGYQTLKCDLHMHTVFSDGQVWPGWRVEEAWRDGLDAIALTDHFEYQPRKDDVVPRLQRPFEIASSMGVERGVIVIRGLEITKGVPPGHFNALFLSDVTALETNNLAVQLEQARAQDAFVFWNHPGWRVKTNDSILLPIHEEVVAKKLIQGVEIYNGDGIYTNVWPWALQNKLTLLANSDTHVPIDPPQAYHSGHRTLTLVFAKERTSDGIKEALCAGRTAVWAGEIVAGSENLLKSLFAASVKVAPPHHRTAKNAWLKIANNSDITFKLTRRSGPGPEKLELSAGKIVLLKLAVVDKQPIPDMEYSVDNMLTAPGTSLLVTLRADETCPVVRAVSDENADVVSINADCISNGLWTGVAVLVGTPEKVIFRKAMGWMDREKTIPMRVDAIFDLASVTKVVGTASALAICMDRGLLEPDVVFTNYLTGYKGTLKGPVTVRDLARHISGLDNSKFYDKEGQVTDLILSIDPVCPAGEKYCYSCANYILLGLIVEKVSGKSLADFCRENIFEPVGMLDTRWAPLPNPDTNRVVRQAETQTMGMASDPPARNAGRPVGNAGLFSTVDDLGLFCRMVLAGGKFGEKRVFSEQMVKFLGTRPDLRSPAAFGWRVDTKYNPPSLSAATMSHTGWAGNSVWIDPVRQCYVVVLANRLGNNEKAGKARVELAESILKTMKDMRPCL